MSAMAEVILRTSRLDLQDSLSLARELSAAGFGPVREVAAEALEEAAVAAEGMHDPAAPDCQEWADWLRARAAAVRGEG